MATEAEIQKRIAAEQAKIDVPSYQDVAFDGAWKRRSGLMWGMAIVGAVAGAAIGAGALLAPAIFGELALSGALIGKSMIALSGVGLTAGWAAGAAAGFPAGAAASTMKEFERRTIARDIEQKIRDNPDATVMVGEQLVEKKETSLGLSRYFNWKSALVLAGIGALGGAIFAGALALGGPAAAFAMPAMEFLLGAKATAATVAAYTVGLGALAGAFFGVNVPLIGRKAGDFMSGILSGRSIDAPWPKEANLPDIQPILSPVVVRPEPEVASAPSKSFAAKEKRTPDFEALVAQSIKEAEYGCNSRA